MAAPVVALDGAGSFESSASPRPGSSTSGLALLVSQPFLSGAIFPAGIGIVNVESSEASTIVYDCPPGPGNEMKPEDGVAPRESKGPPNGDKVTTSAAAGGQATEEVSPITVAPSEVVLPDAVHSTQGNTIDRSQLVRDSDAVLEEGEDDEEEEEDDDVLGIEEEAEEEDEFLDDSREIGTSDSELDESSPRNFKRESSIPQHFSMPSRDGMTPRRRFSGGRASWSGASTGRFSRAKLAATSLPVGVKMLPQKCFSILECFRNPTIAADPRKTLAFAVCRVAIGRCHVVSCVPLRFGATPRVTLEQRESGLKQRRGSASGVELVGSLSARPSLPESTSPGIPSCESLSANASLRPLLGTASITQGSISTSLLPFLVVSLDSNPIFRTRVISSLHSEMSWNDEIDIQLHSPVSTLGIELFDKDFDVGVRLPNSLEDERLAGIQIETSNLSFNCSYSTNLEVSCVLPASLKLQSAIELTTLSHTLSQSSFVASQAAGVAAAWSRRGRKRFPIPAAPLELSNPIETLDISNPKNDTLFHPAQHVVIQVQLSVQLVSNPAVSWRTLARFAAFALPQKSPPQIVPLDTMQNAVDVNRVQEVAAKLKLIYVDALLIPLYAKYNCLRRWENPIHSTVFYSVGLLLILRPYLVPSICFAMATWLLLWGHTGLPPLEQKLETPPNSVTTESLSHLKQLTSTLQPYESPFDAASCQSPTVSFQQRIRSDSKSHTPSPFVQQKLHQFLTGDTLDSLKRFQIAMEAFARRSERCYELVRGCPSSSYRSRARPGQLLIVLSALLTVVSLRWPAHSVQLFSAVLALLATGLCLFRFTPVRVCVRVIVATTKYLKVVFHRRKHRGSADIIPVKTF